MSTTQLDNSQNIDQMENLIRSPGLYGQQVNEISAGLDSGQIDFEEAAREAFHVEGLKWRGERDSVEAIATGGNLLSVVFDETVRKRILRPFTPDRTVMKLARQGRVSSYHTEYRPILEAMRQPTRHTRGGSADHNEIRVVSAESLRAVCFTTQFAID